MIRGAIPSLTLALSLVAPSCSDPGSVPTTGSCELIEPAGAPLTSPHQPADDQPATGPLFLVPEDYIAYVSPLDPEMLASLPTIPPDPAREGLTSLYSSYRRGNSTIDLATSVDGRFQNLISVRGHVGVNRLHFDDSDPADEVVELDATRTGYVWDWASGSELRWIESGHEVVASGPPWCGDLLVEVARSYTASRDGEGTLAVVPPPFDVVRTSFLPRPQTDVTDDRNGWRYTTATGEGWHVTVTAGLVPSGVLHIPGDGSTHITVRGADGLLNTTGWSTTLTWLERPNFAVSIKGSGATTASLSELAESLVEISSTEFENHPAADFVRWIR